MIRKHKKYSKPRNLFDKQRIEKEKTIIEKYGLKSKKEIWKAEAAVKRIRKKAKSLITKSEEEKKKFVEKLQKNGFRVENIADALALNKEDLLKRRLQTIVFLKKLAPTQKQARQLIVHKHVLIGDQIVNIPSYQVSLEEEPLVRLNLVLKINEKRGLEEIKNDVLEKKEIEEETSI